MSDLSLSARRAWIEIKDEARHNREKAVALRKESVDRNGKKGSGKSTTLTSLSARRAWIEMVKKVLASLQL